MAEEKKDQARKKGNNNRDPTAAPKISVERRNEISAENMTLFKSLKFDIKAEIWHLGDYISKFNVNAVFDVLKQLALDKVDLSSVLSLGLSGRLTAKRIQNTKIKDWKILFKGQERGAIEFVKALTDYGCNLSGLTQVLIASCKLEESEEFKKDHPVYYLEDFGSLFPLERDQLLMNVVSRFNKAFTIRGYNAPTLQVCLDQVNFVRTLREKERINLSNEEVDERFNSVYYVSNISSKLNQIAIRHADATKTADQNETARQKNLAMREVIEDPKNLRRF